MTSEDWQTLRESLRELADAYVGTDPKNAHRYREEVEEFCDLPIPIDATVLAERLAEATAVRARWAARMRRNRKP